MELPLGQDYKLSITNLCGKMYSEVGVCRPYVLI